MFARNSHGERRVSPPLYKLLLTAHLLVSVGWLGVVFAKVVLEVVALTTPSAAEAESMRLAVALLSFAFPPLALSTIISGVLLSLGTKWGLLKHTWVAAKIVLTVGIIATAVQLIDRFSQVPEGSAILGLAVSPAALLLGLSLVHLVMLGAATVLSVYKPWGKTWLGRREAGRPRPVLAPVVARVRPSPPQRD